MSNLDKLHELVSNMLSDDNTLRKNSESLYSQWRTSDPSEVFPLLLQLLTPTVLPQVRSMSAVLLKYFVSSQDFLSLHQEVKNTLKQAILVIFTNEPDKNVSRNIVDVINTIMEEEESSWPELLSALGGFCGHEDINRKEIGFYLMGTLTAELLQGNDSTIKDIVSIIMTTLHLPTLTPDLFKEVLNSIVGFVVDSEVPTTNIFHEPFIFCLKLLTNILTNDEETGRECLLIIIDIVLYAPSFLRKSLSALVDVCYAVSYNTEFSNDTREIALEVLDCLSESSPITIQKNAHIVQKVFSVILLFFSEIDDVPNWEQLDGENEFKDDHCVFTREIMLHFSVSLGCDITLNTFNRLLLQALSSNDWKHQYAGLLALSHYVQGCHEDLEDKIPEFMKLLIPYLQHSNYRLRFAALHVFDSYAQFFSPTVQELYADDILKLFISQLNTQLPMSIYGHILYCLETFCDSEYLEESRFTPYVQPLLQKAVELIHCQSTTPYIQQNALGCISAISTLCDFTPYFQQIYRDIQDIIINAKGPTYIELRSKAIDCLGVLIESIGADSFRGDSQNILKLLFGDSTTISYDDPSCAAILRTCVRIAEVMGTEFMPYLSMIFPALYQMSLPELDESDAEDEGAGSSGKPGAGGNVKDDIPGEDDDDSSDLNAHTEHDEERCEAYQMFRDLGLSLKDYYYDYLSKTWSTVIDGIKYECNEAIRSQCALSLSVYLDILLHHQPFNLADADIMFQQAMEALFERIKVEQDLDTLCCLLQSLSEVFGTIAKSGGYEYSGLLKPTIYLPDMEIADKIVTILIGIIETSHKRREEINRKPKKVEDDDEEEVTEKEKKDRISLENEIMYNIEEAIGYVIKLYKDNSMNIFANKVYPVYQKLISIKNTPVCYEICHLCILENVVETYQNITPYFNVTYEIAKKNISHSDALFRQASSFCIGILALRNPQGLVAELDPLYNTMKQVLVKSGKKKKYQASNENIISAIGKMLQSIDPMRNKQEIWDFWLENMPIVVDGQEAVVNHYYLVKEIQSSNNFIVQPKNYPHISYVLCRAFLDMKNSDKEQVVLSNDETKAAIPVILKQLFTTDPSIAENVFRKFNSEEKRKLSKL